jgi:hypothetical protein
MMKSRHLAAIAVGTCVGLAGVGQVASARRGGDSEAASSCSTSQSNDSENTTGDVEQSGLINVGGIALQGLNLSVIDNLLCHGDLLNNLTGGILGRAFGAESDDDDDDSEGSCGISQDNGSDNESGDTVQGGLINVGGIALQGTNLSALGNVGCGGDLVNGLLAGILGGAFGGGWSSDAMEDSCNVSQENDSENETGDVVGLGGLLNVGGVALQGNNIGALDNLLCGSNILNDVTAAVLGIAGRF